MTDRISGMAAVVSLSLDPSVQKTMTQDLPQAVRAGSSKVADELQYLSDKTKTSLNNTFGNLEQHFGSVLDRMGQRLSKGNFTLNTEATLKGLKEIGEELGNIGLVFSANKLLDLGQQLRLPLAISQAKELAGIVEQIAKPMGPFGKGLQSAGVVGPFGQGIVNSARQVVGAFGQGLVGNPSPVYGAFGQGNGSLGVNTAKAIYGAFGAGANISSSPSGAFGLGGGTIGVNDPRAVLGAFGMGQMTGTSNVYGAFGQGGGNLGANNPRSIYGAFGMGAPAAASPSGPFGMGAVGGMSSTEIERRAGISQRYQDRLVNRQLRQSSFDQMMSDDTGVILPTAPARKKAQTWAAYYAAQEARGSSFEPGQGKPYGWLNGIAGKEGSHRFRFASQQIGFGLDDAIQSYHYGGAAASVRAASNNATALASTLISNPVTAALTVVGVSVASAILAYLLPKYGIGKAMQDMTGVERQDFARSSPESYSIRSKLADYNESIAREFKSYSTTDQSWRNLEGGAASGNLRGGLATQYMALSSLRAQQSNLRNEQARRLQAQEHLEAGARFGDPTAKKAYEDHLQRMKAIEIELGGVDRDIAGAENAGAMMKRRIPFVDKMNRSLASYDLGTQDLFSSGQMFNYEKRMRDRAAFKKDFNRKTITDGNQRAAANMIVDQELADQLNNPLAIQRQMITGAANALSARYTFNNQYGSTGAVGDVTTKYGNLMRGIGLEVVNGSLSPVEGLRRTAMLQESYGRDRARAIEDEREGDNPERNPLSRLQRRISRRLEDFNREKGLTDEERRKGLAAILTGAERERSEILRPSGTRRFSAGSAIDVNSQEDFELRARMTGSFQWEKKVEHGNLAEQEAVRLLTALLAQLKVEAEALGRK